MKERRKSTGLKTGHYGGPACAGPLFVSECLVIEGMFLVDCYLVL
jgi:hypothetical protein